MFSMIISGGQTGADRAALDAGLDAAFPVGGSCPLGREAEDGPISDIYNLVEIDGGYRQRTKINVADADGTVIFYESHLRTGTEATVVFCIRLHKPYKLIDIALVEPDRAEDVLVTFVREFGIETLNVAGPSASRCPAIYVYVKRVVGELINRSGS